MDDLEWHDFGLKKASKNSIVYPTLKIQKKTQLLHSKKKTQLLNSRLLSTENNFKRTNEIENFFNFGWNLKWNSSPNVALVILLGRPNNDPLYIRLVEGEKKIEFLSYFSM